MLTLTQGVASYRKEELWDIGRSFKLWQTPPDVDKPELVMRIVNHLETKVDWTRIAVDLPLEARMLILAMLTWPSRAPADHGDIETAAEVLYNKVKTPPVPSRAVVFDLVQRAVAYLESSYLVFNTVRLASLVRKLELGVQINEEDLEDVEDDETDDAGQIDVLVNSARCFGEQRYNDWDIAISLAAKLFPYLHPDATKRIVAGGQPAVVRYDGPVALYDLVQVAAAARHAGLRMTQKGPLYKKNRDYLESRLLLRDATTAYGGYFGLPYEREPLRLQFLLAWGAALRLIVEKDGYIVTGPNVATWMEKDPAEQLRSLLTPWLDYVAQSTPGVPFVITALLAAAPTDWLDLNSIFTVLIRLQHTIVSGMRVYEPYGAGVCTMRTALAALVYMGVLEIGSDPETNPIGLLLGPDRLKPGSLWVRLHPAGRQALLDQPITPASTFAGQPPRSPLVVQPNFEVIVQPFSPTYVHWALTEMADLVRPDQAYVYRITRDSIIRARRAGLDAKDILAFLSNQEQHSATGQTAPRQLPQNVEYSIRNWSSGFGRCVVMRIAIVQCENAALADRLLAEGALREMVIGRVSPTALLVRDDALKRVIGLLEKAGLPPPAEPVYVTDAETAQRCGMSLPTWSNKQ